MQGPSGLKLPDVLPARYKWYPNFRLDLPIVRKKSSHTPGPKQMNSYMRHASVKVRNDPITPNSCLANMAAATQKGRMGVSGGEMSFGMVSSAVKT